MSRVACIVSCVLFLGCSVPGIADKGANSQWTWDVHNNSGKNLYLQIVGDGNKKLLDTNSDPNQCVSTTSPNSEGISGHWINAKATVSSALDQYQICITNGAKVQINIPTADPETVSGNAYYGIGKAIKFGLTSDHMLAPPTSHRNDVNKTHLNGMIEFTANPDSAPGQTWVDDTWVVRATPECVNISQGNSQGTGTSRSGVFLNSQQTGVSSCQEVLQGIAAKLTAKDHFGLYKPLVKRIDNRDSTSPVLYINSPMSARDQKLNDAFQHYIAKAWQSIATRPLYINISEIMPNKTFTLAESSCDQSLQPLDRKTQQATKAAKGCYVLQFHWCQNGGIYPNSCQSDPTQIQTIYLAEPSAQTVLNGTANRVPLQQVENYQAALHDFALDDSFDSVSAKALKVNSATGAAPLYAHHRYPISHNATQFGGVAGQGYSWFFVNGEAKAVIARDLDAAFMTGLLGSDYMKSHWPGTAQPINQSISGSRVEVSDQQKCSTAVGDLLNPSTNWWPLGKCYMYAAKTSGGYYAVPDTQDVTSQDQYAHVVYSYLDQHGLLAPDPKTGLDTSGIYTEAFSDAELQSGLIRGNISHPLAINFQPVVSSLQNDPTLMSSPDLNILIKNDGIGGQDTKITSHNIFNPSQKVTFSTPRDAMGLAIRSNGDLHDVNNAAYHWQDWNSLTITDSLVGGYRNYYHCKATLGSPTSGDYRVYDFNDCPFIVWKEGQKNTTGSLDPGIIAPLYTVKHPGDIAISVGQNALNQGVAVQVAMQKSLNSPAQAYDSSHYDFYKFRTIVDGKVTAPTTKITTLNSQSSLLGTVSLDLLNNDLIMAQPVSNQTMSVRCDQQGGCSHYINNNPTLVIANAQKKLIQLCSIMPTYQPGSNLLSAQDIHLGSDNSQYLENDNKVIHSCQQPYRVAILNAPGKPLLTIVDPSDTSAVAWRNVQLPSETSAIKSNGDIVAKFNWPGALGYNSSGSVPVSYGLTLSSNLNQLCPTPPAGQTFVYTDDSGVAKILPAANQAYSVCNEGSCSQEYNLAPNTKYKLCVSPFHGDTHDYAKSLVFTTPGVAVADITPSDLTLAVGETKLFTITYVAARGGQAQPVTGIHIIDPAAMGGDVAISRVAAGSGPFDQTCKPDQSIDPGTTCQISYRVTGLQPGNTKLTIGFEDAQGDYLNTTESVAVSG